MASCSREYDVNFLYTTLKIRTIYKLVWTNSVKKCWCVNICSFYAAEPGTTSFRGQFLCFFVMMWNNCYNSVKRFWTAFFWLIWAANNTTKYHFHFAKTKRYRWCLRLRPRDIDGGRVEIKFICKFKNWIQNRTKKNKEASKH